MLCFLLMGCTSEEVIYEYSGEYTLSFYYVDSCSMCQDFKDYGIDYLKEEFGDVLHIQLYNMDDAQTKEPYDAMMDAIDTSVFVGEYYGMAPMLYVEGYFAKLGIYKDEYPYLVQDIRNAMNGDDYTLDFSYNRALVKESE